MKPIEIQQRLNDLFQTSPVVIWNDTGAAFSDSLGEFDLPGVEVLVEQDGTRFELKFALNGMRAGQRFLLYRTETPGDIDWLADTVSYAPPFSADRTSLLLEELNARNTPEMRAAVEHYAPYLTSTRHVSRVQALRHRFDVPQQLALAVMAAALGKDVEAEADHVAIAYFCAAHARGDERAWAAIDRAGAGDDLARFLSDCTGFSANLASAAAAANHVLTIACATELDDDALLPGDINSAQQRRATDIARLWMRLAGTSQEARAAFQGVAQAICDAPEFQRRLDTLPTDKLAELTLIPAADAIIVKRLLAELAQPAVDVTTLRTTIEHRKDCLWAACYRSCYDALTAALDLKSFAAAHQHMPTLPDAASVWHAYTSDWSGADTAYRHFHVAFSAIRLDDMLDEGDASFHRLADTIEAWYRGRFLRSTARVWEQAAAEGFAHDGAAPDISRLADFYLTHVEALARKKRTWVIISDALRFEVARELADALEARTQGKAQLDSMQAPFPSITLCGMAALLPHSRLRLTVKDHTHHTGLSALVDGMPTQGTQARQAVLKDYLAKHRPGSCGVALQAKDFLRSDKQQRKEAVGDASLIYLYHNRIDAIGDDASTEDEVFHACADTIDELCQLVSQIVRDFRASDILITADHGFLYTYQPPAETDKIAAEKVSGTVIEFGRRYVVGDRSLSSEVTLPVSLETVSDGNLAGLATHEAIRIKKAGGGDAYVHGGISLQELCVPVIHFKNYRSGMNGFEERTPATLSLVSQLSAVTNLTCTIQLLQDAPAGGKTLPAAYAICLQTGEGELISDAPTVRADRTDADPTRRTFSVTLHVRSTYLGKSGVACQLIARRLPDDTLETSKEANETVLADTQLQIAFAPEDSTAW